MPKLYCTQQSRWGTQIRVCNSTLDISREDGSIEASDEQAQKLLANPRGKWRDGSDGPPPPPKNMPATAILENAQTGETRTLEVPPVETDPERTATPPGTAEPVEAAEPAPAEPTPPTPAPPAPPVEPEPAPKPEPAEAEASEPPEADESEEPDWPEVSTRSTRPILLETLEQLAKHGHVLRPQNKDGSPDPSYSEINKEGLVDLIANAYSTMS